MAGIIGGSDWMAKIPIGGTYTSTTADASANKSSIDTGKADATGFIVQVIRANIETTAKAKISMAAGVISVEDNGADFVVTNGDVIHWIVY